jgi:hypothetical protein
MVLYNQPSEIYLSIKQHATFFLGGVWVELRALHLQSRHFTG